MNSNTDIKELEKQRDSSSYWGETNTSKTRVILKHGKNHILDIGCANGGYVHYLLDNGYDAHGCDILAYDEWSENSSRFKKADIYHLPYKDKSFDTVILFEVLEHLQEPEKALQEISRVVKKNVIISVPNCDNSTIFHLTGLGYYHYFDRTHMNFYTEEKIKKLLVKNGFRIEYLSLINPVMPEAFLLYSWYFPLRLAVIIGKIFQRSPIKRKFYTDIIVVFST